MYITKQAACAFFMVCAGIAQAQTIATYEVTFTSTWSATTHPTNFPSSPHYSGLIGGTHNSSATFWETGSTASLGIKEMAEFGSKSALRSEVQTAIGAGTAERVLSGGGIGPSPGVVRMTFDVSEAFPLVTLTSMLAPSPDWFVGVNGHSLRSATDWKNEDTIELFVYDAGTDSGPNYTSSNQATNPRENIARIATNPFIYEGQVKSVGTFVFSLQSTRITAGLTVTPRTLALTEGGNGKDLSIALATQPAGSVTVSVTALGGFGAKVAVSPNSLTFSTTDWRTAQQVTITPREDDGIGGEDGTISIAASGGGYQGVTETVAVSVQDDDSGSLMVTPRTLDLTEGGNSKDISIALSAQPAGSVTVSVTALGGLGAKVTVSPNSLTFSTTDWRTAQQVTITPREDDGIGGEDGTISIAASGGGYQGVTETVAVSVQDDDSGSLTVTPRTLDLTEGGNSKDISIALSAQPTGSVAVSVAALGGFGAKVIVSPSSLTFSTTDWSTAQLVTITPREDDGIGDETGTISIAASGGGYGGVTETVAVEVEDDDSGSLTVTPRTLDLTEGGNSKDLSIALSAQPTGSVAVSVEALGGFGAKVTVSPNSLTFSTTDWSTAQLVTITPREDDGVGDETGTISIAASGGGYGGVTETVAVQVFDGDASLTVTPLSLDLTEGGDGKDLSIALSTQPTGRVIVSLSAQGEFAQKVNLSPFRLGFTISNWSDPYRLRITAEPDADSRDESGTLVISASGGGYNGVSATVSAQVQDDDVPGLSVQPESLELGEGGSATVSVRLNTEPSGTVTVSMTLVDGLSEKASLSSATLAYDGDSWATGQEFTVTAKQDDGLEDETGTLSMVASGVEYNEVLQNVPVTVEDDDAAELVVELDSLSVMEGGVGMMVEVSLGAQPTGTVAVAVSATGGLVGKVSFSPASLEYTVADWQVPQVVTVRADQDEDVEDESGVMELKATGGGYDGTVAQVLIAVSDDDMLVDMCYMTESERSAPPSDHMISASNEGYWMTSGIEILDTTGTAVQIKGVGLGGWLMPEGYMLHTPQASPREIEAGISELIGEAGAEEFWELYRQFYVREADVAAIKEWGFDHIRLPFHYNLFYDDESEMFDEAGFDLLDRFLEWCREHGLGVILDMHAAPGAQSEHNIADSDGEARLWTQPEIYWPIARRIWTEIARRYAEEKLIIGYDLLNEPVTPDGVDTALLGTYYRCLVPAVRKVDPHHIVFIEGNFFATDFGVIEEPFDPNMVYTFHKYWNAANQGTINYLLDLRNNAQRPLWLGETGENSNVWFAAVVKLMGDHNIGWNWWTHKKILTTTSPLSAPFAEGYQEVLEFWRGEGPRPTEEDARSALLGMARGLDIENSELRHGVLGSLFDPDFFRSRKPFREGEFITEHAIPGQIHAADYDLGGHGWTYFDTDYQAIDGRPGGGNSGASYRNDGVDIQVSKDPEGFRYNVGWTHQGEWLTYTVRVAEAGAYDIEARVASEAGGGAFRLILGGESIGEIEVASTGGWQDWESRYLRSVDLPAGQHEMRIYFTESDVNLNTLFFRPAENRTAVAAEEIPLDVEVTAVYPNPFGEEMNVEFRLPERGSVRAEMFDMLGRRVYETSDLSHDAGQHALPLRPGLVPGVYMLRLDIQMDQETVVILRPVTVVGSLR